MSKFDAPSFWDSVDDYYTSKDATYSELLYSAASRRPTEAEEAEQKSPKTSIFTDQHAWARFGENLDEEKEGEKPTQEMMDEVLGDKMKRLNLGFEEIAEKHAKIGRLEAEEKRKKEGKGGKGKGKS